MLTIFNRRELIVTMDMKRQAQVREILAQNGIDYDVKTVNLMTRPYFGTQRARTGSYGVDLKFAYEYKIYVHKKDFEKAAFLIR